MFTKQGRCYRMRTQGEVFPIVRLWLGQFKQQEKLGEMVDWKLNRNGIRNKWETKKCKLWPSDTMANILDFSYFHKTRSLLNQSEKQNSVAQTHVFNLLPQASVTTVQAEEKLRACGWNLLNGRKLRKGCSR